MLNTDDVAEGRDGWLFLTGGSNNALGYYKDPDHFSPAMRAGWSDLILRRAEEARTRGIRYFHVTAPDKLSVYGRHLSDHDLEPAYSPARALPEYLASRASPDEVARCYLDLLPSFLKEAEAGRELFYKTDSHWNFAGALLAYQQICLSLGAEANPAIATSPEQSADLILDLGGKLNPPRKERYAQRYFVSGARRVYANPLVRFKEENGREHDGFLHVGCSVIYENPGASDPRTVILYGDSFSEYRPFLLTGMLAETFRELHFVWSSSVDWAYIDQFQPDVVITELAERFFAVVPADGFDIEEFAHARMCEARDAA